MTNDRVIRSLVIVVLVLGAAVLALLLLGWLTMAAMMAGGMMGGIMGVGSPMAGAGMWAGLLTLVVVVGVVAALIWALRTPAQHNG